VVTPKIPRVKSICLSQEEVVPDMKWVRHSLMLTAKVWSSLF